MSSASGSSQPDHSPPLQDLLAWIQRRSIPSYEIRTGTVDTGRTFMPNLSVESYFQEQNFKRTKQLLNAVFSDGSGPSAKDVAETCPRIFCILALISKAKYIGIFAQTNALSDSRLPFESRPRNFPTSTNDPGFFDKFYKKQWQFCALDLSIRSRARFDDDDILPFSELKKIAGGGHATVYKATVHSEHDKLGKTPSNCYALKTFSNRDKDFESELDAFQKITAFGTRTTDNIIEFYGGFEYRKTFNIVLEYAEGGTLEQYFQQHSALSNGQDIIDFWEAIFAICQALRRVHESHLSLGAQGQHLLLQGWHQDLKPRNILVVKALSNSRFPWIFKIADLGLSHFKRILEGQGEATDLDSSGTRTYGAPECYAESGRTVDRHNHVKRSIDIWSLGGIYSEAAVGVVHGYSRIETYRDNRKKATDQLIHFRDGDCFHDGDRRLQVVDAQHEALVQDMHPDDFITGHALQLIGKEMLHCSPGSRPTAEQLVSKAESLIEKARSDLAKKELGKARSATGSSYQRPSTHQSHSDPTTNVNHYRQDSAPSGGVYSSPQHTSSFPSHPCINTFSYPQAGPSSHPHGHGVSSQAQDYPQNPEPLNYIAEEEPSIPHRIPAPTVARTEAPPHCTVEEAWQWHHHMKYHLKSSFPHEGLMWELDGRDHVFMIDDSRSMEKHWKEVEKLAHLLAFITKKKDRDGLELYFLSSETEYKCHSASKVSQHIQARRPDKLTNLNSRLATDLRVYRDKIDGSKRQIRTRRLSLLSRNSSALKERSIYVFTDGVWESGDDDQGHEAIIQTANKLAEAGLNRKQIGIQFIRFGDHPVGKQRLEILDNLKETYALPDMKDIVDTEPANGNVCKMLLGAINSKFDGDPIASPSVPYGIG